MQNLTSEQKQKVVDTLKEKGVTLTCPMCGNKDFVLIDGYFNNPLQSPFGPYTIGGPSVPSAALACSNCGFISQHALGMLGLIKTSENK
jgi:predicted RNA-binding Zn-ribbon protein involved in translation (DUF1610 family)